MSHACTGLDVTRNVAAPKPKAIELISITNSAFAFFVSRRSVSSVSVPDITHMKAPTKKLDTIKKGSVKLTTPNSGS